MSRPVRLQAEKWAEKCSEKWAENKPNAGLFSGLFAFQRIEPTPVEVAARIVERPVGL